MKAQPQINFMSVVGLGSAMAKLGMLPANCIGFELLAGSPDDLLQLRFTVQLTVEDMKKLAAAVQLSVTALEQVQQEFAESTAAVKQSAEQPIDQSVEITSDLTAEQHEETVRQIQQSLGDQIERGVEVRRD